MCGRYDLSETGRTLRVGDLEVILTTSPRYNIAPLQTAPVLRQRQGELFISDLRWGLVPYWSRDAKSAARCINARSESVADAPMFRAAFQRRRCLIPADGYFEWEKSELGRLPWRFRRRDRAPLLLAGLWESWKPPDAAKEAGRLETYTILTTSPNGVAGQFHDRMPVILDARGAEAWLDERTEAATLASLCMPPGEDFLECFRVSPIVNNSRNDSPECVQPLEPGTGREPDDAQQEFLL